MRFSADFRRRELVLLHHEILVPKHRNIIAPGQGAYCWAGMEKTFKKDSAQKWRGTLKVKIGPCIHTHIQLPASSNFGIFTDEKLIEIVNSEGRECANLFALEKCYKMYVQCLLAKINIDMAENGLPKDTYMPNPCTPVRPALRRTASSPGQESRTLHRAAPARSRTRLQTWAPDLKIYESTWMGITYATY